MLAKLKARHYRCNTRLIDRRFNRGSILIIVLFIMVSVALLSAQGLRLMLLTQRSQDQRFQAAQRSELLELARLRLTNQSTEESFTVPVSVKANLPERIGHVTIEKIAQTKSDWRITVRYPYNEPSEQTVLWEGTR